MLKYEIKAGTTDVSVVIRIIDSADGTPETGVVFNTAGIDLEYRREGAVSTDITEATLAALTTAHTDGGFLHIGNGYYRLDLPDAACATGSTGVLVHGTVTGMVVIGCYIQLVAYDPFDTVRLGLTALPNVASGSAGAIITSGTGTAQLSVTSGRADANVTHYGGTAGTFAAGRAETNMSHIAGAAVSTTTAQIGVNIVQVSGDSTSADNLESYTDGTTPMPVNTTQWGGTAVASAIVSANMVQVSGDATSADNLESYTDGTTPMPVNTTQWGGTAVASATVNANMTQISSDSTAADNLELAYDDTAGAVPWHGIIDQGTAQAATATTLQLRSAAAFANDTPIGSILMVFGSTQGYWQARQITDYVSSTDTATVDTWTVTPSGTITYKLFAAPPAPATPPSVSVTHVKGRSLELAGTDNPEYGVNP